MSKNYFTGLRNAPLFERGNYLEPGYHYKLKITRTFIKETRQKGDAFIANFEVLESNNPKQTGGTQVSYYQGLTNRDVAFSEIKAMTYAALGLDPKADAEKISKEIDPQIEGILSEAIEKNTMSGSVLSCQTTEAITRAGVKITRYLWMPCK